MIVEEGEQVLHSRIRRERFQSRRGTPRSYRMLKVPLLSRVSESVARHETSERHLLASPPRPPATRDPSTVDVRSRLSALSLLPSQLSYTLSQNPSVLYIFALSAFWLSIYTPQPPPHPDLNRTPREPHIRSDRSGSDVSPAHSLDLCECPSATRVLGFRWSLAGEFSLTGRATRSFKREKRACWG